MSSRFRNISCTKGSEGQLIASSEDDSSSRICEWHRVPTAVTIFTWVLAIVALAIAPLLRAGEPLCCDGGGVAPTNPATQPSTRPGERILRISADPNNLPFSNDKLEGFENKLAELIAKDLGAKLEYHWRAQRRGFFRNALKENECDLVLGVPAGFERALCTSPYYRSSYVFVARKDSEAANVKSFDDPALKKLKIGVQLIGDDGMNTPPAHALASRGVIDNVVGFTLYGDYREPNPPARIVDAVADGTVDLAVVWGPLAGYFAGQAKTPLAITPVSPETEPDGLRFAFSVAMGVRKSDKALRDQVEAVLKRRRSEVEQVLDQYHLPRLPISAKPATQPAGSLEKQHAEVNNHAKETTQHNE